MVYPWLRLPGFRDVDSIDNREPAAIEGLARTLGPLLERWFSPEVRGLARIPEGAALYVGNHSGGFVTPDTWILGLKILRARGIQDVPYGLGHQVVMEAPGVNQVLTRLGGLEAKAENAHRVFEAGGKVLVYPGGDLDAFRPSRDRNRIVFGPRRGYVRLALREGVPIVPVVTAGAHDGWRVLSDGRALARRFGTHRFLRTDVLPVTLSLPWGVSVGAPPYLPWPTQILIEVLEPVRFERSGAEAAADDAYVEACHRRVHGPMEATLVRLAHERHRRRRDRWRARFDRVLSALAG
ncbi:MAG TPA: lysophospholipid acyltransferase family protein [Sandaracinaceae bacterium LLY-WYZ-13_1]|nr:lysophospholipid acyltransferase family protein [Sandaracinaceae bacterium LLY-WYZ-13_1]